MKATWATWTSRAARLREALAASGAGAAAWGAVLLLLGAALVGQSIRSGGEVSAIEARAAALDREIEGLRRRNQGLREEVRALETDPVYLESVLRSWKRVGEGERPVE